MLCCLFCVLCIVCAAVVDIDRRLRRKLSDESNGSNKQQQHALKSTARPPVHP